MGHHYKVCVYAISKNEEQFARRWMDSMSEADEVCVLDTGSKDQTVPILRELGAKVTQEIITPWRFDTARNRSLELVSEDADLCVCTDLDEVFTAGWREKLEAAWREDLQRLRYRYVWNYLEDGSEGRVFWLDKAHCRHGWTWVNPVHEVLLWSGAAPAAAVYVEGVTLEHHADNAKSRAQYLPLLELAVAEDPQNDRNMHYLGREYLFYRRWDSCIRTLERHLALPTATWADERCASMRYLARAWEAKGDRGMAQRWLLRAVGEAPHLREPWMELSRFYHRAEDWEGVLYAASRALSITQRPRTYITEAEAWGEQPYDLTALACYYLGLYERSAAAAEKAVEIAPQNQRLVNNLRLIREKCN